MITFQSPLPPEQALKVYFQQSRPPVGFCNCFKKVRDGELRILFQNCVEKLLLVAQPRHPRLVVTVTYPFHKAGSRGTNAWACETPASPPGGSLQIQDTFLHLSCATKELFLSSLTLKALLPLLVLQSILLIHLSGTHHHHHHHHLPPLVFTAVSTPPLSCTVSPSGPGLHVAWSR